MENREKMKILLERETLDSTEFTEIMDGNYGSFIKES